MTPEKQYRLGQNIFGVLKNEKEWKIRHRKHWVNETTKIDHYYVIENNKPKALCLSYNEALNYIIEE